MHLLGEGVNFIRKDGVLKMRNIANNPKHLFILNILSLLFAGFLALTYTAPFQAIGNLDDWHYYNELVEYQSRPTVSAAQTEQSAFVFSFLNASSDEEGGALNVSDASDETIALVKEAKHLLYAELGDHPALLWDRFKDLQVKDCDINGSLVDKLTLAFYEPEENTIYCNRQLLYAPQFEDSRLHILVHELTHALLEKDKSCIENQTNMLHEGFTEYLAQLVCPVDSPSYFLNYCIAEVYVKDNGLNWAIERFVSGQAEEDVNQRLQREKVVQNINGVLLTANINPKNELANKMVLDVYLHYVQITGVDVDEHVSMALKRIPLSFENLAALDYFNELRKSPRPKAAAFSCHKKCATFFRLRTSLIIKHSF